MCFQSWSVAVQLKTTDKQQQRLTVKVAGMFASQLIYIYTHTRLKALTFYNLRTESLKTLLVQLPPISFLFQYVCFVFLFFKNSNSKKKKIDRQV